MNKRIAISFFLVISCLIASSAQDERVHGTQVYVDSIFYWLNDQTNEAAVAPYLALDIPDYYYLSSYTIPEEITVNGKTYQVTEISDMAFRWARIKEMHIPGNIKRIGNFAFEGCSNLECIYLSEGIEEIGHGCFGICESLKDITLPASVKKVAPCVFRGDVRDMAENIFVNDANPYFMSVDGVLCSRDGTLLEYPPHKNYGGEYTTPDGIKTIGKLAFFGNGYLSKLTVAEGTETICDSAFVNMYVSNLILPASIRNIGDNFTHHFGILEFLENIHVNEANPYFKSIDGVLYSKKDELLVFPNWRNGEYSTPKSIKTIGRKAFSHTKLSTVTFSEGTETIGDSVFVWYDAKQWYDQQKRQYLERINIASTVKSIGKDPFGSPDVFSFYNDLSVYCYAENPPACEAGTWNYRLSKERLKYILYVPEGSEEKYRNNEGWKGFMEIRSIPSTDIMLATAGHQQDGKTYRLDGTPVQSTKQGIYIKNGKKWMTNSSH